MSDAQKIERLEKTLGTLITWLVVTLGVQPVDQLLKMLSEEQSDE